MERFGAHGFAKLKQQTTFLVKDAFGLDALLDQVLQDPAERQLGSPCQALALLDHLSNQVDGQLKELFVELVVNAHGRAGIVDGAMRFAEDDTKLVAKRAQAITRSGRHQDSCQFVGVDDRVSLKGAVALEEADVKADVLPQDGMVADEGLQLWVHIREQRSIHDHGVGDASQVSDEGIDRLTRVDEGREFIQNAVSVELHRTDLDDRVVFGVQTSCFNIQGDDYRHGANYTRSHSHACLFFPLGDFRVIGEQPCQKLTPFQQTPTNNIGIIPSEEYAHA